MTDACNPHTVLCTAVHMPSDGKIYIQLIRSANKSFIIYRVAFERRELFCHDSRHKWQKSAVSERCRPKGCDNLQDKRRRPSKGNAFLRIFRKKYISVPLIVIASLTLVYSVLVFSPIPFIAYLAPGIWIETAMTTADHQWLATAFIPKGVIDKVMNGKKDTSDVPSEARTFSTRRPIPPTRKTRRTTQPRRTR